MYLRTLVTFRLDFTYFADTLDCLFPSPLFLPPKPMYNTICRLQLHTIWIWFQSCVRYDLAVLTVYNINLRATNTTILSTRGVTIPIWFVSGTTDSIRWHVVLFKPVTVPTSDPKSEFLCQSSSIVQNLQTPLKSPHTPGISPTPSSPCITLTPTNQVLLPSTSSRNYAFSMLNFCYDKWLSLI